MLDGQPTTDGTTWLSCDCSHGALARERISNCFSKVRTRDIPANVAALGNPARVIREI